MLMYEEHEANYPYKKVHADAGSAKVLEDIDFHSGVLGSVEMKALILLIRPLPSRLTDSDGDVGLLREVLLVRYNDIHLVFFGITFENFLQRGKSNRL